jgi:hypothetical protein
VTGAILEMGCALGGSAIVIAATKAVARPMSIYDTFELIPPPTELDGEDVHSRYQDITAGKAQGIGGDIYYGYRPDLLGDVAHVFELLGVPPASNHVALVKGLFEDTLHVDSPIALAHIDCDWHASVTVCLERIVPRLSAGGRLVVDDYDAWSGCRSAIDEFFADKRDAFVFERHARLHIVRAS